MAELSDFPPEEQELIKEMLSLDYTREDFEKRKRVILSSLSTDGLRYVQEHLSMGSAEGTARRPLPSGRG